MPEQVATLKASPSLTYQNLSHGDGKFVYLHKNEAHIFNLNTKETSSIQAKEKVHQAKICNVNGQNVIVLIDQGSIQFWDLAKEKCIFTVANSEEGSFLSRGLTASGSKVFVGYSTGAIAVVESNGTSGSVATVLRDHKDMISDLTSGVLNGAPVVVSADLVGEIMLWDPAGKVVATLDKSPGESATCLAVTPLHVACGYGSGKLRLFNPAGKKVVEIAAHCRWINALDYCEKKNLLASASEDSVLQLWQVPTASDLKVSLKTSKVLKDGLLTGVKFTEDGAGVACASYDTEKFHIFNC